MKNYTILDKDINKYRSGKNKNTDIYLYGFLKACCSNYRTGESHATQNKIQQLTKISLRTIQSSISRLRETELMKVETRQVGLQRFNKYFFNLNPEHFFFVNNSFYYVDILQKEKGLLLLIKSLCINNSNTILYSRTKIAELIDQDRNTISKMMNELIRKNMLLEIDHGFQLPANYFPLYSKDKMSKHKYENFNSYDQFVLNSILDLCTQHGSILFTPDLQPLKLIFAKYPILEKDIKAFDLPQVATCYLPLVLINRCTTLPPKIESLNYFLKALNIEYVEVKRDSELQITL